MHAKYCGRFASNRPSTARFYKNINNEPVTKVAKLIRVYDNGVIIIWAPNIVRSDVIGFISSECHVWV